MNSSTKYSIHFCCGVETSLRESLVTWLFVNELCEDRTMSAGTWVFSCLYRMKNWQPFSSLPLAFGPLLMKT